MKREKAFSKGGAYSFVLSSNLLLHKEVGKAGIGLLRRWLQEVAPGKTIRVLDLACGGAPVSICTMISAFPDRSFEYTGIDINPDQVECARRDFEFPGNVSKIELIEGNAWDFHDLVTGAFDIIFTGMNLHHGVPEELYYFLLQSRDRLADGGLLLNHDCYRPDDIDYLRRPQFNPANASESFAMVPEQKLQQCQPVEFPFSQSRASFDWRVPFVEGYAQAMRDRGCDEESVREVCDHILNRDYPVSFSEMRIIASRAGLKLTSVDLAAGEAPLSNYMMLLAMQLD